MAGYPPTVVIGGLLIVFSMWWIYFDLPVHHVVGEMRRSFDVRLGGAFAWGYGHYFVFMGAAATGTGLAVAVDQATGAGRLTDLEAGLAITVPVTGYVVAVWALHRSVKPKGPLRTWAVPVAAVAILTASATPEPVLATGVLLAALLAVDAVAGRSEGGAGPEPGSGPSA